MVKLTVNLDLGTIDLETDNNHLPEATEHAERLIKALAAVRAAPRSHAVTDGSSSSTIDDKVGEEIIDADVTTPTKSKGRKKAGSKGKNWEFMPTLLDDEQWKTLQEKYRIKSPHTQNEKVAVITSLLAELTKRPGASGDEIHSAFRTLGEKTPANLMAVLGNMATAGLGNVRDGALVLAFKGKQMVDIELPKAKAKE